MCRLREGAQRGPVSFPARQEALVFPQRIEPSPPGLPDSAGLLASSPCPLPAVTAWSGDLTGKPTGVHTPQCFLGERHERLVRERMDLADVDLAEHVGLFTGRVLRPVHEVSIPNNREL